MDSAVHLIIPKGIRSPVQTLGCSFSCRKPVACRKVSELQNLITNHFGELQQLSVQREHTGTTQVPVKNISVGIITLYLIKYLSSLISLKGVGNIHYNGENCTTVLAKEVPSLPQLVNGSHVRFFLYYQIFVILNI